MEVNRRILSFALFGEASSTVDPSTLFKLVDATLGSV